MTWQKILVHISTAKLITRKATPQDFADAVEKSLSPPSPKAHVKRTLYVTVDFVWNGISTEGL